MTGDLTAQLTYRRSEFVLAMELNVAPGSVTAMLGPNGAGKSTVVDLLTGVIALHSGRIALDGRVLDDPAGGLFVPIHERGIGVVHQDGRLFGHLDVTDNVAFPLRAAGASRRASRTAAREWLERFGLSALADRRPAQLSGGQAQRVAIARVLAREPSLLLLDEPMAALDIDARSEVRTVLAEQLQRRSGATLLVTHEPDDATALADDVIVIENGKMTQRATPAEIHDHPATPWIAAFAGTNQLRAERLAGGTLRLSTGHTLICADDGPLGDATVVIRPEAVSLHPDQPVGSPRNAWQATVLSVDSVGRRCRVVLDAPIPLRVDVTRAAVEELHIEPGGQVWASVKATEIEARPIR